MTTREDIGALIWEWSPLGDDDPFDPHLPRNEYDWLIDDVETKLAEGLDAERLGAFMTDAVRSQYGLEDPPSVGDAAERIVAPGG